MKSEHSWDIVEISSETLEQDFFNRGLWVNEKLIINYIQ